MRRVALLFVGALLVAGVAGAQGDGEWCPEGTEPCLRVFYPADGDVLTPPVPFLMEVVYSSDPFLDPTCELAITASSDGAGYGYLLLQADQHERPHGRSPVFLHVDDLIYGGSLTVFHPQFEEGDYLPFRFRLYGEIDYLPLNVAAAITAEATSCGEGIRDSVQVYFRLSD